MKNRIKISLSFMLLVSMFLIFQGCQKETFSEPQNDSKYVTRKVTFDDIKNKPELSKPFKLLKNVLDFNAKNKSLPDSFVIETDQIIEVIAGNKISYSFKILNPIDLTSVFENFIIDVSDPQNTKYFIFQYKYKKSFEKGEFPFDVTVNNLSEYQIEINNFQIYLHKWIMCIGYQNIISPRDNPAYDIEVLNWWDCSGGNTDGAEYVVDMSDLNSDSSNNNDSDSTSDTDSYSESGNYHDNTGSGGTSSSTSGSNDYVDPDGHAGVNFSEIEYVESILTNLTDEQIAFLYNPNNDYEVSMIAAFLSDNKTTEAVSFAKEAFVAMMNDGEVDYVNKIILDSTLILNERLNCVYNKFKNGTNTVASYLTNFLGEKPVGNLKFIADDNFKNNYNSDYWGAGALTISPENYMIKIVFNTDVSLTSSESNMPTIVLGLEFIHEMIHAEMYRKLLSYAQKPEIPWTEDFINGLKNNFPGLTDYYTRYWLNLPPDQAPTNAQHQLMAQHYIETIKNALKDFDDNQHSDEFYTAMAWAGLRNTVAWNELTPSLQAIYINTLNTAIQNETHNCNN